jgi:hypothetical protein
LKVVHECKGDDDYCCSATKTVIDVVPTTAAPYSAIKEAQANAEWEPEDSSQDTCVFATQVSIGQRKAFLRNKRETHPTSRTLSPPHAGQPADTPSRDGPEAAATLPVPVCWDSCSGILLGLVCMEVGSCMKAQRMDWDTGKVDLMVVSIHEILWHLRPRRVWMYCLVTCSQ